MKIVPARATLGATVTDLDLGQLNERESARIIDAWHRYGVLVFPRQYLDDEGHIAFSRLFGKLERLLTTAIEDSRPEIFRVGNVRPDGTIDETDGAYTALNKGNQNWHTDSSYKRITSKASALRAKTLPTSGGETQFADMRAAYEALDDELKAKIENKMVVHDFAYSHGQAVDLMTRVEQEALPPVQHRLVRVHEATGKRALFAGRHASHIVGEAVEPGRRFLADLTEAACQAPRIYTHEWQEGDLVIWDNRCVLHRGLAWPPNEPRLLFRTTVACEGPNHEGLLGD